ncbi:MAG: C40 family peptidase [Proteobacteria bacterium]|nr:C40 family peptidase [Pseudomonadota bacterium]
MHKNRSALFLKTCTWLVYVLMVFLSTSLAFGVETKPADSLSAFGLTDQEFENRLKQYVGIRYRKGGTTTNGLDCSGFVRLVYDQIFGINLPHNSMAQFKFSDLKKIDNNDIQPGDLIFFSSNGKKKRINHVGVYLSDNKFIHASSTVGIKVSGLDERYWKKRFVGTKRHEFLSSDFDSDQERIETTFQIPLHDNGSLIGYTWADFSPSAWAIQEETETTAFDDPLNQDDSRQYLHEIGYVHTLSEGFDINITAIHENFEIFSTWPEFSSENQDSGSPFYDDLSGTRADRMGFRLAGAFQPSLWLSLSPSITFYDYARKNEDLLNAPEWMLGLNTVILPTHQQWSLSMMLQYSEKDDFRDISLPYRGSSSIGLAVRLGIHLTENLNFSIMGEHDKYSTVYGVKGDSQIMEYRSSNVSMAFGFSY